MKLNLTFEQQQAVASLLSHPGYIILLTVVREELDQLLDQIFSARTDEEERRLVNEWKALRRLAAILENLPRTVEEAVMEQVEPVDAIMRASLEDEEDVKLVSQRLRGNNYGNIINGE